MLALYGHLFSSYTWKGLIPLYALGVEFEFRGVGPDTPENGAFVAAAHPAGKFPVLVDGDTTIVEATAIIEYLAVKHPGSNLIPADPLAAVTTRMLDRVFDNYVMGIMQAAVVAAIANPGNPDPAVIEKVRADLRRSYAWLENWLGENTLPPHVSLVTCAAAPSLFYADWVERIPEGSRLAALRAELLALPEVSRCVEDARPMRHYFPLGAPDRD
jgi:glutathione S-transferase